MEKCKIANILNMANRRTKRSEIWDLGVVSEVYMYVQYLELWPMAKFHAPKKGNFEYRSVSRKPLPIERN